MLDIIYLKVKLYFRFSNQKFKNYSSSVKCCNYLTNTDKYLKNAMKNVRDLKPADMPEFHHCYFQAELVC